MRLPEFAASHRCAFYIGVRSEVATRDLVEAAFGAGKQVGVVYRDQHELGICLIQSQADLAQGSFGLWEPLAHLRAVPSRHMGVEAVDVFIIPGVAFDRRGGRLGYGRGYYDTLLRRARPDAHRIALAFDSQLIDRVPMGPDDQPVQQIVTEKAVYRVSP